MIFILSSRFCSSRNGLTNMNINITMIVITVAINAMIINE